MEVLSGVLNDLTENSEMGFGLLIDSQTTVEGNQAKIEGKFMEIDKKVEKTRNEVMKSVQEIQEIHGEMKKNHSDMMKSFQETRDQLDRIRLEVDNAMKIGEKQSKTWVDMALGNNLAISQKVKEIQQHTKAVAVQNEHRQREINSLRVIVKGVKESPRQNLVQIMVELCNRNFKNIVFKEEDFTEVYRIGSKIRNLPRPIMVRFKEKKMRRIFWLKRFYLGKGEKVFVDADLSFEQRRIMRERIQEIKDFNQSKSSEEKLKFKRVGFSLVVEGRLFSNMEMKLEQFLHSTLKKG